MMLAQLLVVYLSSVGLASYCLPSSFDIHNDTTAVTNVQHDVAFRNMNATL